jgi:hypothetical protein
MKVLTTAGLTKLIQLIKSAFISVNDTEQTSEVSLATVATTGAYSDLTGKPTIPVVYNSTITFTQGGVTKGSVTLNQSYNATIALDAGGGSAPTNMVTTNTAQDITAKKTFVGDKLIAFKQSSSSSKLGFTLYNNDGKEKGYLEFNPNNTVDSAPLMTLGNYATSSTSITHVGFRKYDGSNSAAYNLLAPLASNAKTPFNLTSTYKNFYIPLGFTDGTTTVKAANTGMVDLSSIIPSTSGFQTTANLVTSVSSSSTDTQYPSAKCVYDIVGDVESLINAL